MKYLVILLCLALTSCGPSSRSSQEWQSTVLPSQAGAIEPHFQASQSSVRITTSEFRLIRQVSFQGRDLFDLAIKAGMYKRKGTEYLPGAERGAVSVGGRTWHGSNGVGLVAYDPHMGRYAIYYLQDMAVPGHHLSIVYSDTEFVFFHYGWHRDLPTVTPALQVYSVKHDRFACLEAVTSRGGRFGHFDMDILATKKPGNHGPSMGWNHQRFAEKEWVPLTDAGMWHPDKVTKHEDVITLSYHTDWGIDEFVTAIHFKKSDLQRELDKMALNETDPSDDK